jgi:hypothetical protein
MCSIESTRNYHHTFATVHLDPLLALNLLDSNLQSGDYLAARESDSRRVTDVRRT